MIRSAIYGMVKTYWKYKRGLIWTFFVYIALLISLGSLYILFLFEASKWDPDVDALRIVEGIVFIAGFAVIAPLSAIVVGFIALHIVETIKSRKQGKR